MLKLFLFSLLIATLVNCEIMFSNMASKNIVLRNYKNARDYKPSYGSLTPMVFGTPDIKTGQRVAEWDPETSKVNPEELGNYVAGDILIPKKQDGRNGLVATASRWRGGVIPFFINGTFSRDEVNLIHQAFDIYKRWTCIRFVPWSGFEPDFISIENSMTGCWASVGRLGGRQVVNLQSPGCLTKVGTPLHELMHSVGFLHEQNRYERDNHVNVMWDNIVRGKEENFKKAPSSLAMSEVPYDYSSVMHYTLVAFSTNGEPTLRTKVPGVTVGQREGLSRSDVQKIRLMYKCEGQKSHV